MKKLYSLIFLLFSFYANAQPPANMPNYKVCDSDTDGFASFDLASQIPAILNGLNPSTTTVTFHETSSDAQAGINPITAVGSYTNIVAQSQGIYIRVMDNDSSQIYFTTMLLQVLPTVSAGTDGGITVCESMPMPIDLFSLISGETAGGTWTRVSGAGGTFNPVAGTYTPAVGATTSTFHYSIGTTPCIDSSVASVFVIPQPNAGLNGSITVCGGSTVTVNLFDAIDGEQPGGTWVRVSGAGGTFDAVNGTYTAAAGATTSTFSYTLTGTAPCINDSSTAAVFIIDCINQPVCGGLFTDSGGPDANYAVNTNTTTTICPTSPGDSVTVTFTSFSTEATYDALYVYDGSSINAPMLPSTNAGGNVPGSVPGGYWGNSIPGPFTSTSIDGCLTFRFLSDPTNTAAGWVANVDCIPMDCETPTNLAITNLTNTSAVLSWTNNVGASSWEVLVIPQGSPGPPPGVGGIIVNTNNYIVSSLVPDQCYTAYVRTRCAIPSAWSVPVNFCLTDCTNTGQCPQSLALIAFLDGNNNGTLDTGEMEFNHGTFVYQVNDSGINQYGSSNSGNYLIFDTNPSNSYDINFELNDGLNPYYNSLVTHNNISIPSGSGINYLYFPVVNTSPYVDAQVNLYPSGQPRPGFTYFVSLSYKNNGFEPISGTLSFTKHPSVSIVSVSQAGTTATTNGFTYDFANLPPMSGLTLLVGIAVPTIPNVNLGDLITNSAAIEVTNDVNAENNSASLTQVVVGSYDPNDKCESHGGKIVHSSFTSDDYLNYTIQFENTGTANAEFIRVEDALDSRLDESSFEMLSASHAVNTKREGSQLTWHFYNIDLPPTVSNPAASHGYINFRIKPKTGYAIGDIIPNTASIYFDYNPAIVTNTFNTEFVQSLGNSQFNAETIQVYPNPASTVVSISSSNSTERISKVVVYEITGKKIYSINDNPLSTINIDVSHFTKGIYLVELWSDNNIKITKKLILN